MRSPGSRQVQERWIGAVFFLHGFGSSLNAHFHYHAVVLDGVLSEAPESEVRFHEASELAPQHWQELQRTVQRRVLRYFRSHDLLDEPTIRDMLTWQGTSGFSIDASVRIEGHDRHGIERLVRYCARPPFALHRLHATDSHDSLSSPAARLLYRLPGPTPGRSHRPPPHPPRTPPAPRTTGSPARIHRHRYHGYSRRTPDSAVGSSSWDAASPETIPKHRPKRSRPKGQSPALPPVPPPPATLDRSARPIPPCSSHR
ncbi:transposase [Gemmatimonadota bacterium]